MLTAKAIANGNPRCWHCLNRLVFKKGGGFNFALVRDRDGTKHRVHHDCVRRVVGDGVKAVPA